MVEHLDRFKHKNKMKALREKSTQYYYFSDAVQNVMGDQKVRNFIRNWIFTKGPGSNSTDPEATIEFFLSKMSTEEIDALQKDIITEFSLTEEDVPEQKPKELPKVSLVPGTLVLITDYGSGEEPRKYMWNKSRGEILTKNKDGTYKIRITDVKDSNVLYSKKWYDQEQKALTQKLNLPKEAFKTLKEIEDEEKAAAEEAERSKKEAEAEKAKQAKEKEAEKAKKEKEKADKAKEAEEKEAEKQESIKRMSRRLL
jgi:flagellar biosynthesis GTPase FlhF